MENKKKEQNAVSIDDVVFHLETADDMFQTFLNTETGGFVTLFDDPWDREENERLAEELEEHEERYIRLPGKYEIHEYAIMEEFSRSLPDENLSERIGRALRGKGAFRRFKDCLYEYNLWDAWNAFEQKALRRIAVQWCEENHLLWKENGKAPLRILPLDREFSVCRLKQLKKQDLIHPFTFSAVTDEEISLVVPEEFVPEDALERSDGWRGLRIEGQLDFSLTGILAGITGVLAEAEIPVFAVSTFRTDYIFVKEEYYEQTCRKLEQAGYVLLNDTDD